MNEGAQVVDLNRHSVALCAAGTQTEFERRLDEAMRLYRRAWDEASDDYERCVAAHYIAHLESDSREQLRWNLLALEHAGLAEPRLVEPFLGSLYVNLGHSYELNGDPALANRYYALAEQHGVTHHEGC